MFVDFGIRRVRSLSLHNAPPGKVEPPDRLSRADRQKSMSACIEQTSVNSGDLSTHSAGTTLPGQASDATANRIAAPARLGSSYDGSQAIFRLLRLETWGSPLMNLGYFMFRGPFAFLNVLASLESAQHRLVMKSVHLLDVQGEHRVLDLACGRGKSSFIIHCLHPQATVVGLDLVERQVEAAETLYGNSRNLSYVAGNAMLLDFPDESFDRIMCLESAFDFSDRAQFLRESFRVLRPGGRLVVVDFTWSSDAERMHRNDPETKLVRQVWQWDDFSSVS